MSWEKNKSFVNPYNFVTLPIAPKRESEEKQLKLWRGTLSGVIHCSAENRTPIALPDHSYNDHKTHHTYPFFNVNGEYRIPGSELRGVVRSIFETVTDSCMSELPNSSLSSRNEAKGKKAGILRMVDGRWELYPADTYIFVTYTPNGMDEFQQYPMMIDNNNMPYVTINGQTCHSGDPIAFYVGDVEYYTSKGYPTGMYEARFSEIPHENNRDGYIILGEHGPVDDSRRHHSHVISAVTGVKALTIDAKLLENAVENLRKLLNDYYRNEKINSCLKDKKRTHYGYAGYEINGENGTPVFYNLMYDPKGNAVTQLYLSPAIIAREVHPYTLFDYAAANKPCSHSLQTSGICPACALFGLIRGDKEGRAYGGAVRFSDGKPGRKWDQQDFQRGVTLKILGGPKISAVEFYTKDYHDIDETATAWNYGYYLQRKNPILYTDPSKRPQIRGRKFYFQQNENSLDYIMPWDANPRQSEQNYTTDLLKPGKGFSFDVYFDGISKKALYTLLWCIAPFDPQNEKAKLYLSIGSRKPLGLGSISAHIDSVELREVNESGYHICTITEDDDHAKEEFLLEEAVRMKKFISMICPTTEDDDHAKEEELLPEEAVQMKEIISMICTITKKDGHVQEKGQLPEDAVRMKELISMLSVDTVRNSRVCYPIGYDYKGKKNARASHQWFAGNHRERDGWKTLPLVCYGEKDNYYELPAYYRDVPDPQWNMRDVRQPKPAEKQKLFDATCDNCGAACQVPFRPTEGKSVYCRECYRKRK